MIVSFTENNFYTVYPDDGFPIPVSSKILPTFPHIQTGKQTNKSEF